MDIEKAAAAILQRGVALDNKKKFTEALVCYQEGLQLLVDLLKVLDGEKKTYIRKKIEEYMTRAENIKKHIENLKDTGTFHEQIKIENDSIKHSYDSVFGRFLDEEVTNVKVEDPYIRSFHQCQNFIRLCELLVKRCNQLQTIDLLTTSDTGTSEQTKWLKSITDSLMNFNIKLNINYSSTLHDRQITLSSGWIIKIGRGLDYFKAPENKFTLGVFDLDLRPCYETSVDIFHTKTVKQTNS